MSVSACAYFIRALIQKKYESESWIDDKKYLFLIAALFSAWFYLSLDYENLTLYQCVLNGEHTEGCVCQVSTKQSRGSIIALSDYTIRYNDNSHQEHTTVCRSFDHFDIGDKADVYYKRDNPSEAYAVMHGDALLRTVLAGVFGICLVLLSIVAYVLVRHNTEFFRDTKRLIIYGSIAIVLSGVHTFIKTISTALEEQDERQGSEPQAQQRGTEKMDPDDARLLNDENWNDVEKAFRVWERLTCRIMEEAPHDVAVTSERWYQYCYHSLQWLQRAAALGEPRAQVAFLGYEGEKMMPGIEYTQAEFDRYKATVLKALEAVPDKTPQHWYAMGMCYEKGYGVEVDEEKARELKNKSALMRGETPEAPNNTESSHL